MMAKDRVDDSKLQAGTAARDDVAGFLPESIGPGQVGATEDKLKSVGVRGRAGQDEDHSQRECFIEIKGLALPLDGIWRARQSILWRAFNLLPIQLSEPTETDFLLLQLVASSTVGIAAAGLALGKPERTPPARPTSKKRKAGDLVNVDTYRHGTSSPLSRPGTSSTAITPENKPLHQPTGSSSNPSTNRTRPPSAHNNSGGRRLSIIRYGEASPPHDQSPEESRRDSVSSRGSWMRRLSTIPNSYNNSPRSSVGPESPSLTFSHGSAAPILSDPANSPAQLPPNKLVKRATSGRVASGTVSRSGSKSQVPTLRRPATSHQRSVNLQQQFRDDSVAANELVQQTPSGESQVTPSSKFSTLQRLTWRPYFEARPTKVAKERLSGKSSDRSMQDFNSASRRIILDESVRPTLVKPAAIDMMASDFPAYFEEEESLPFDDSIIEELEGKQETAILSVDASQEPQKRPRRSLSLHFSSPGSWITRSGSLRGNKRGSEVRSGGKRYASDPISTMPGRRIASAHGPVGIKPRAMLDATVFEQQPLSPIVAASPSDPFASSFRSRSRNASSPLPPLSRLSSFNVDLARLGLSSSSSSAPRRSPSSPELQPNTTSTSLSSGTRVSSNTFSNPMLPNTKLHRTSEVADRASTLVDSDTDPKGYASGDNEEMDFQSETVFDSLRSGATGSIRSRNPPLDTMFDESPPSLNGHSKSKRLSIHEILGNATFSEGHNRIIEEDEDMSTPVKPSRLSHEEGFSTPIRPGTKDSDFPSSPPSFCLATKDFSRLSLDDEEEEEDWTRDDENMDINNQLSPPSNSLNSRRVSSSFRAALADVTHSTSSNGNGASAIERPKSNLFDWSEPSSVEKLDYLGNSQRPQTAHVKQIADGRGGRSVGRRGPTAIHIRSQSVPVVPDVSGQRDNSKLTPKFGTWGLGAKGVSEDWDNDFEFENGAIDEGDDGDISLENSGMLIPPTIQASQANVVGHVGQIREVCLLVEDLKRLRLLAKEKDLLYGSSAPLWKEAEGIIALAVPDEEDLTLSPPHSPSSMVFDKDVTDENNQEAIIDTEEVQRFGGPVDGIDRHGRPKRLFYDSKTVRRKSVFSPEDDIFGAVLNTPSANEHLRPPPISPKPSSIKNSSEVARSVMETMHQHRAISDPLLKEMSAQASNKMPFDTTSLRDLVHRASVLSRTLADLIRKADGRSQSPEASPRRDSSPAFTRVFTDPMASPPKHLPRTQSNNSILSGSIDSSPTRNLGQRMHMMTVV
ncbi:hypothetical protein G7Y89_g13176 [Cudoniella acicularis]|uniref:Uncharacterized protein n=1 Tax=Cudoniella acicularis TaxID=354080 RepID=A0A8H4R9T7_9HELO|nr:hypothetical protein G7Y89_g13176 [Cudoniella acicularis]